MPDHDRVYHRLFSHPAMVAQLLREFVTESWVADLRLEAMERLNTKFHGARMRQRDSDIVWRIPMTDGGDAYLLLMLEFQSKPDRWMAVRAMVYAGLLWQQIVREKRIGPDGLLPPVFPLVLYNGDPRWRMPATVRSLIGLPESSPLWRWQPAMEYHVLDEGAFDDVHLAARNTLAALLFRLEKARQPAQIEGVVDDVIAWFRDNSGFDALAPVFAALAGRALASGDALDAGTRISENLLEIRTMLANRPAEWKRQWRQEGRQEGQADLLLLQLERRFGGLPPAVSKRIASADPALLKEWGLRILDAKTLDDVLLG